MLGQNRNTTFQRERGVTINFIHVYRNEHFVSLSDYGIWQKEKKHVMINDIKHLLFFSWDAFTALRFNVKTSFFCLWWLEADLALQLCCVKPHGDFVLSWVWTHKQSTLSSSHFLPSTLETLLLFTSANQIDESIQICFHFKNHVSYCFPIFG